MGGGDKPDLNTLMPKDPQFDAVKAQAETDRIDALKTRVGTETSDLLRRYGARVALSGANVGGGKVSFASPSIQQAL